MIGILGGMGPEATSDLYLRIIRIFQREYSAMYDADFPEIIILNLPILFFEKKRESVQYQDGYQPLWQCGLAAGPGIPVPRKTAEGAPASNGPAGRHMPQ